MWFWRPIKEVWNPQGWQSRREDYCCSFTKSCSTLCNPWTSTHQAFLSFTISWSLLKLISIELVMLSNHFILCHPLFLLPSNFPSIRVFLQWVDLSPQFIHSVMSDSLWSHESQHARPSCSSPTPGVHSNLCTSSRWCHPDISSSVFPFSSCPQSLPASESFPMSQLFTWGGQSTGVSASASVLPKNTQDWCPLE